MMYTSKFSRKSVSKVSYGIATRSVTARNDTLLSSRGATGDVVIQSTNVAFLSGLPCRSLCSLLAMTKTVNSVTNMAVDSVDLAMTGLTQRHCGE